MTTHTTPKKSTLIVFDESPEGVRFFLTSDPEIVEMAPRWHGKFINGDELDADLQMLTDLVYGEDGAGTVDPRLVEVAVDGPFVLDAGTVVVSTGMLI